MAKAKKEKEEVKVIKQGERNEYTVAKNHGPLKKGQKIMLHSVTGESFKKRGIVE